MEGSQARGNNGTQGVEAADEITKIPIGILKRIMYHAMPLNTKINADAKEAMSECVTEFAAVLIQEARQVARDDSRVVVSGDDIITALGRLGFSDYVAPLSLFLRRYCQSYGIVPRGWQAEPAPPGTAAVAAVQVEMQQPPPVNMATAGAAMMMQPPEPDLTLGLALPGPRDVTELGFHEDVYKLWPGRAAGPMPPAVGDQ